MSAEWHECQNRIMPRLIPRATTLHATCSHAMSCCANGGGGADLAPHTLGLAPHPAWEAGRGAQSRDLKSPAQTGQRHEPAVARRRPACWPMSAMVWALRWAVGWGGKPNWEGGRGHALEDACGTSLHHWLKPRKSTPQKPPQSGSQKHDTVQILFILVTM